MRVHISDVQIGDLLLGNVFNQYGLHVLSNEKVLDAEDIYKLQRHNIEYVEIQRRVHAFESVPKDVKTQAIIKNVQPHFDEAVSGVMNLFGQALEEGKIDGDSVQQSFIPLVDSLKQEKDVVSLLLTLNGKDDYTFHHSVQVGMISYFLAKWLDYSEMDSLFIGKSGYLHDIGKSRVDNTLLQKPAMLTTEEFEVIKNHTVYGSEIIEKSKLGSEIAAVALQHHERLNGKGYPHGMTAKEIHPLAKIVAVADVYSAMISSRVYKEKRDLLVVLKELYRLSFSELDPVIVHTFISHMMPNFIGKKVALKDGQIGYIVMINPSDYFRPLIQIEQKFFDLSKLRSLEIETIYL